MYATRTTLSGAALGFLVDAGLVSFSSEAWANVIIS